MPRIASRRSDTSDFEPDGLAEQELVKLRQEYRVMEGDRKAYGEESQHIIRKQREAIEALQAENEELAKENKLAGSQQNLAKDSKNVGKLTTLLQEEEELKKQVDNVKEEISKREQEIQSMEKRIGQQRKHMGGLYTSQVRHVGLHKEIRMLENRLDQASKKFNQALSNNKNLREEIDHMRTERAIFDGLYKKLEKKMNDNKEAIAKVIEESTLAYVARDDAQNKMIALKEKSDKELLQYNMELKELMRVIDHDKKLKEFMNIKAEDRAEVHGLSVRMRGKHGEDREKAGEKEVTIQSYEAAFDKIKETTKMDDLQKLVGKFIETEDKNFAMFNYVNELNNEIEILQEQIVDVENEIRLFNKESEVMDEERQLILDQINLECENTITEFETHNATSQASRKILNDIKDGINSLFSKIGCNPSIIVDMLGGHEGITDANMMQFLGIIEQRTNELIQVQAFISSKENGSPSQDDGIALLGKGPLPVATVISVQAPQTVEEYDSDMSALSDDENRPLSQDELKQRIMKGIVKREVAGGRKKDSKSPTTAEERNSAKKSSKSHKSPMKER